jgi:hypothetical protein
LPLKYSAGPLPEGCEPIRVMFIFRFPSLEVFQATRLA